MKTYFKLRPFALLLAIMLGLHACENGSRDGSGAADTMQSEMAGPEYMPTADTLAMARMPKIADGLGKNDTGRQFIRTAEMRFRTKDVMRATQAIEEMTERLGGYITQAKLSTGIYQTTLTPISEDSAVETVISSPANNLTIRVPSAKLDVLLNELGGLADRIDFREISTEDVTQQVLRTQLSQHRAATANRKLSQAQRKKSGGLGETIYGIDNQIERQAQADEAKIEELLLMDKVRMSTLNLGIYGREVRQQFTVLRTDGGPHIRPSFGYRLGKALRDGWWLLGELIVLLTSAWGLIAAGVAAYFIIQYLRRRGRRDKGDNPRNG